MTTQTKYQWAAWGDLNAFFGLMLDNVTNLVLLWGLLAAAGFPSDIFFFYMVPGTCLGVMFGDLVYTWMAFRLSKRTGNPHVTAMPLGLDTPSTIGVGLAVLIPCFMAAKNNGLSVEAAAMVTWQVGMATMIFMGVFKVILSFAGEWVQRVIPRAGLLGSLAGIGICLLGFIPLQHIYELPEVGLVALGILIYTLVAKLKLPGKIPGAFAAVLVGTLIYYFFGGLGFLSGEFKLPDVGLHLAFPTPNLEWLKGMREGLAYLPFAIPFGLITIIGGINVTESARCAGDDYNTKNILLTEAFATLIAGLCGGVVQSTPYIGHPAYKNMGARAAYTLATGLFVGLGGILGYVAWVVDAIPAAAVAPILLFVGLEITGQAYGACEKKHHPAIFLALLPCIGELVRIALATVLFAPGVVGHFPDAGTDAHKLWEVSVILGHGFIITSMLWAAVVVKLIDQKHVAASICLFVMAALTFFGFIHSIMPAGDIYFPWTLEHAKQVYFLSGSYAVLGLMFLALKKCHIPTRS
jgi:adenine/guanine/hypoxanthine permease